MKVIKYILMIMCLVIFFILAVYSILLEAKISYKIFRKYYGLSNNQKTGCIVGELYRYAIKCNNIIPEDSSILFLSNFSSNQYSFDLFLNYYLYPRKLFWLNNIDPYPEVPPKIEDLDHTFLSKRNIDWVILRYPREYGVNKVVKLSNGKPIQSFRLD